uniref:Ubiquitin carboxyl-terminal hydrolase 36 n=1 Tax=Drosophila ananassae TaxID=7217 RepID=UBP36_DROAN|nr:RecName: Full=Ubiquitin carboxyl-terminal hydrolase 36; AltName: Full=Deubiquitinating enzyme 36; AltName: Full=Protein scrawny; AltName: Full=Ubiquitin thioesterase 36; AltName: Full=Ubiquitin-specific-processing protease 36 [Drosophila ananassae]
MPVSVAVCETTNVVNAALRESLGVGIGSGGASSDDKSAGEDTNSLQNHIVANAKRILMTKIEYEEVPNYQEAVLENLKSKYIVIKPTNPTNGCNLNGNTANTFGNKNNAGKIVGANGHDNNGRKLSDHPNQNHNHANPNGHHANPNELPKPKRVLYPRENIRIGWKQSERKWQVGSGMINAGNTCYLNSTLQALFHIPALANWLVSEQAHMENCNVSESGSFCIICAMAKTLQATQTTQSAVRPFLIYTKLKQICKHMIVGRQEDAHEFLRFLVEAMERAYLMRFRNYKELDQLVKETTPLGQIFGGYLRSEVRCLSCNHVSITFQHFQDLLLDIRKSDSLEEAFEGYFSREKLEDFGYKCEGCKKKVSATKQFRLERAPITLCIQLKRFSMMGNKLTKQITFKPRIDLSKFAARSPAASVQPLIYRLVSMVTHLGVSQHCGHYTAIGSTEAGSYYNFDDSYVRPIAIQSVCNTNAYIMFYELDPLQTSSPAAARANGLRLTNGHGPVPVAVPATVSSPLPSPAKFIGPQLPPGGINGYSNGHGPKTTIQFKPQHQPSHQQNGVQQSAKSPLLSTHVKVEAAAGAAALAASAAPTANGNKSSSNHSNHKSVNQQHYLPISSEDEDSEDEVKARPTVQLPSMPKMDDCMDSGKPKSPVKTPVKTPLKSLVPYESASEEEEVVPLPNPNARKRSSDSSDSEHEPTTSSVQLNGHSKTNGSLSNGSSKSTDAIDEIFKSLKGYQAKKKSADSEDDDDDEDEPNNQLTNGWHPQKQSQSQSRSGPPSPKTPPSPAVIKSKTGIWKVTRDDGDDDEDDDDDDDEVVEEARAVRTPVKNHRNPFASSKTATDSPTTPGAKRQKLLNGSAIKTQQQPRAGNGYQSEATANGGTVNELLKQSHRGYSSSVLSWNGKPAELEKEPFVLVCAKRIAGHGSLDGSGSGSNTDIIDTEIPAAAVNFPSGSCSFSLLADARDQRQRDLADDEENEMDRGRQRKVKSGSAKISNSTPGYNPFMEFENQKRWHKNGGGGGFPRFYQNQNFRQGFQQRNKFKFNRFGGPGSAKFQQQRALQRHLAAGGGFTRRQPTHSAQQQQQQQS